MLSLKDISKTQTQKYNPSLVMKNRRLFDKILHKIITLCLMEIENQDALQTIVFSETYLNIFNYIGMIADNQGSDVNDTIKQIIGTIMDINEKCPLNPYKSKPLNTASDVMDWFCQILAITYKDKDLTWSSKVGEKVIREFKALNQFLV